MKVDLNNRKHCNRIVDLFAVIWIVVIMGYGWGDLF